MNQHLSIDLRLRPSTSFMGVLAELNGEFSDWTDGSYDWANQTTDFLHGVDALPQFREGLFATPFSQRALQDLLQMSIALYSGNYPAIRQYLQDIRFALVIGYPRSGGSYLTKELLRGLGLDHTRVSETLAHDGFPELRELWFDWNGNRPYYHLEESLFQVAEFLVISRLYYQRKLAAGRNGTWLVPKKMHKIVAWAGSFKMLLGQGRADYLVTLRHPLPTAISIYEKCGGLPADGRFPIGKPRCAIERWIAQDLLQLGFAVAEIAALPYGEAVGISWAHYYTRLAGSGLFLGLRDEVQLLPYGAETMEAVVRQYRDPAISANEPERFLMHDKGRQHPEWREALDAQVAAVQAVWQALRLPFPELSCQ